MNPHATIAIQKIPRFIPHTIPTPPDESDTTGQVFFQIRMNPTSPDQSDRKQPPHNPPVVGSIPTGPTTSHSPTTFIFVLSKGKFSTENKGLYEKLKGLSARLEDVGEKGLD